jgi:RNA polymerase sigma-70 factor (ECF subfamily)
LPSDTGRGTEHLQDEISILAYRAGDFSALCGLISRWQKRIYWYIQTILHDETAAWDVAQEVWVAAISGLGASRPVENFAGWIYCLAHNKAVSHLRKVRRAAEQEADFADTNAVHSAESPDQLSIAEEAELVQSCLQEVPLPHRETLALFYLNDISLAEIARIQKVPPGTIQSRLHYGRKRMKRILLNRGYEHDRP